MKVLNLGLVAVLALAVTACGGGGGGGSTSQPQSQAVQASPKATGMFTIRTVTAPTTMTVADTLTIQVEAQFIGDMTPASTITFPVAISTDGTVVKTVNVTLDATVPNIFRGTVNVTMPAQTVGVHSHGVRLRPADVFTVDGTVSDIEYVTTTVTP